MPAIILAYTGRVEMLRAIFGGEPPPQDNKPRPIKGLVAQLRDFVEARKQRGRNG